MLSLSEHSMVSDVPHRHQRYDQECLDLEVWIVRPEHQYIGKQHSCVHEQNVVERWVNVFAMQEFEQIFKLVFAFWILQELLLVAMDSHMIIYHEWKQDEAIQENQARV